MKNDVTKNYCKRCGASMVDILTIDKNADLDFSLVFHCGHCGECNNPKSFHGLIQFSGTEESDIINLIVNEDNDTMEFYTTPRKEEF